MDFTASNYRGVVWYGVYEPIPGDRSGRTQSRKVGDPVIDQYLEMPPYGTSEGFAIAEAEFTISAPAIHSFSNVDYEGGTATQYVEQQYYRWIANEVTGQ